LKDTIGGMVVEGISKSTVSALAKNARRAAV
jgi:hypothetical protein